MATKYGITYCNVITKNGGRCNSKATTIWGTCQRQGHMPQWAEVEEYRNPEFIGYNNLCFFERDWILLLLIRKHIGLPKFIFWTILKYHLSDYQRVKVGSIVILNLSSRNKHVKSIILKVAKAGWEIDIAFAKSGQMAQQRDLFKNLQTGQVSFNDAPFLTYTWRPEIQKYVRRGNSSSGCYAKTETSARLR